MSTDMARHDYSRQATQMAKQILHFDIDTNVPKVQNVVWAGGWESTIWRAVTSPKMSNSVSNRWARAQPWVCSADKGFNKFTSDLWGAFRGELCLLWSEPLLLLNADDAVLSTALSRSAESTFKSFQRLQQNVNNHHLFVFGLQSLLKHWFSDKEKTNKQTKQEQHGLTCG